MVSKRAYVIVGAHSQTLILLSQHVQTNVAVAQRSSPFSSYRPHSVTHCLTAPLTCLENTAIKLCFHYIGTKHSLQFKMLLFKRQYTKASHVLIPFL